MDLSTGPSNTTPMGAFADRPALQSRLEEVIEDIIADHRMLDGPERDQAAEFTRQQVYNLFENPRVPELEFVLHKTITAEEARHILFFPDEDQAAYYPRLIAEPPQGAPPDHPQRKLQVPHLSLLYLQHWKRWKFVSAFVLAGGLNALCGLFAHSNPIVRMKAVNTFVAITSHSSFDWFRSPRGSTDVRLHRALLALRADPAFLPGLIANSWGSMKTAGSEGVRGRMFSGSTFPGGALMSLELLAMWISWVRKLHTEDGTLRLSKTLFESIKSWSGDDGSFRGKWRYGPWQRAMSNTMATPEDVSMEDGGQGQQVVTDTSGQGESTANNTHEVSASANASVRCGVDHEVKKERVEEEQRYKSESRVFTAEDDKQSGEGEEMHRGLREEWEQVVDLSRRLVEDFGRFPLADKEWEEVRPISVDKMEQNDTGEQSEVAAQNSSIERDEKHPPDSCREVSKKKTVESNAEKEVNNAGNEANDSGNTGEPSSPVRSSQEQDRSSQKESVGHALQVESTPPMLARAQELKALGNAAFRKEDFPAAREAYSDALSLLQGDTSASMQQQLNPVGTAIGEKTPSLTSSTNIDTRHDVESRALRAVLYRNRAAALLRLFDRVVETRPSSKFRLNRTQTRVDGDDHDDDHDDDEEEGGEGLGGGDKDECTDPFSTPTGQGQATRKMRDEEDPEAELRVQALTLLAQCKSDCQKAIEFDGGDKKARFRLTRCSELRERCRRGGLAACVEKGRVEWDTRREQRKRELMAKILARTSGVHEVSGGPGGVTTALLPGRDRINETTTTGKSPTEGVGGSGGGVGVDSQGQGIQRDSNVSHDPMSQSSATSSLAKPARTALDAAGRSVATAFSDEGGHNYCAPREGGEIHEETNRGQNNDGNFASAREAVNAVIAAMDASTKAGSKSNTYSTEVTSRSHSTPRTSSAPRTRIRRLRRPLEDMIARVVKTGGVGGRKATEMEASSQTHVESAMEVWQYLLTLLSTRASLEQILGDGITEELFVGIVEALKYACGESAASQNPAVEALEERPLGDRARDANGNIIPIKHVHQLFLELAAVRRVSVICTMCTEEVRRALESIYRQLLLHCHRSCGEGTEKLTDGEVINQSGEGQRPHQDDAGLNGLNAPELAAAAAKFGLRP